MEAGYLTVFLGDWEAGFSGEEQWKFPVLIPIYLQGYFE